MDLVVAHYKEDLSWIHEFRQYFELVYIYHKEERLYLPKTEVSGVFDYQLPNIGREAHTYLFHMRDVLSYVPEKEVSTLYLQGNPFYHITPAQLHAAIQNYQGGFDWLVENWHYCDRNGSPHHPGLPIGNFYEEFFSESFPQQVQFNPGGQFIADKVPNNLEKLLQTCDKYSEYPWIMERLWKYVF